jgi:hypothetical protein
MIPFENAVEVGLLPTRKSAQRRPLIAAPYSLPRRVRKSAGTALGRTTDVTRGRYLFLSLSLAGIGSFGASNPTDARKQY